MYKHQDQLIFSPSDLTRFMESPFASWMDRFALECPDGKPEQDPDDPLMQALAKRGYAHEEAVLQEFRDQGLSVITIEAEGNKAKTALTVKALKDGYDVVAQARLELDPFAGYADFLVKVSGESHLGDYHYEVWDAKLSTKVKPAYPIQLCCYVEMLEAIQGRRAETITVALGNGCKERLRTSDCFYYYLSLKDGFLEAQKDFSPDSPVDPAESKNWLNWSEEAEAQLIARDHPFQVANITRGQVAKLKSAGIETMQNLAETELTHVPGIHPSVLQRLKDQASIQKDSEGLEHPAFVVLPHGLDEVTGLELLPAHSDSDVFFDIEGFPLEEGGLEYLWGATYFDNDGQRVFRDFWAHDRQQEKEAFEGFIGWAYKRWIKDPTMHIYHYANYEISACKKLMGRFGVCEDEVDQLLRNQVFVDLYKVVKGAIRLGEPRYSIKNVEHLYRGKRDTEVGSGGDSVVVYDNWRTLYELGEEAENWEESEILKSIRDYNIDDCDSTQELTIWLRKQQQANGISYRGRTEVVKPEMPEEISERTILRDDLLEKAEAKRSREPQWASLAENMAWFLEFHRRESKPVFWRRFERLGLSHEELLDDLDCLACCQRTS
ncbi:TM0106 family RecB-like putative nuclease [Sansalvadorimonas verongulae]|uniref:TM0106 family RecB-like putative nuclease n=1 Tax=Sansalvadorimonas verongulae TaxID=2172824 RepID=UPI0012BBAA06|nr:TM0106 family RecB-like putative nuclease [Sansalvadorimonas verongulae]MTI13150.1 TM0106 family RecB-like putative nuclease [Sansalvadorimonas verongulae]